MTKTVTTQGRQFVETFLSKGGADATDTLFLMVKSPDGKTLTVDAVLDRPVKQAVLSALAKDGVSAEGFANMDAYVLHAGKVVDLDKTVANSGLTREATLHVIMRVRGAGNPLTEPPEISPKATYQGYAAEFAANLNDIPGFRNKDLVQKFQSELARLASKDDAHFGAKARIQGRDNDERKISFCASIELMVGDTRLTKREGMLLKWMMGVQKKSRGERGIGLKMDDQGKIEGRPPFSTYTKTELEKIELESNIDTNMRHVVAWHTIREAYNALIDNFDTKDAAFVELAEKYNKKEAQIPQEIKDQLQQKIEQLRYDGVISDSEPTAQFAYKALYVMNSNVENLWKGDALSNQILPIIMNQTSAKLEQVINGRAELSIQDCYDVADQIGVMAAEADKNNVVYSTALLALSIDIERYLQEYEASGPEPDPDLRQQLPDLLRFRMRTVCAPAEIDLISTDGAQNSSGAVPEADQVKKLRAKPSVDAAMKFLTASTPDDPGRSKKNIMELFESLLTFDELSDGNDMEED